jgi:hypothetical protein
VTSRNDKKKGSGVFFSPLLKKTPDPFLLGD